MNKQLIKALKGVSNGMVVLAILFAFLISGIRIFGIQVYGVLTGSMEPTYPTGSLIYVKSVNAQELRVNDVITFSLTPGVIATHRIVEVVPDENNPSILRFRTKGDANNDVDASLVSAGNIVGKVAFSVPGLGYLASYIQQPPGIYVAILVGGLMIAFVFYTDSLENKQKQNQPTQQRTTPTAKSFHLTRFVNQVTAKLLGKPVIQEKKSAPADAPSFRQGYVPPQPVQTAVQPPVQPYGYSQQNYGQQGYGQPVTYSQQSYYQQPTSQQYYNPYQPPVQQTAPPQTNPQQVYGQQTYQPSYQQQMPYPVQPQQGYSYAPQGYQQLYAVPPNQANGYQQQNDSTQQQRRNRRTARM